MPATLIEVRCNHNQAQEIAMIEAVHSALVSAFRIPPTDKTVRLVVHEPHRMYCSPKLTQPELFTLVSIDAFAGRSLDAKRALYKAIVTNLEPLGIPPNHVKILLRDLPKENWGIRGGQAGCDVELGFTVEV
ncbi:tautomerase family protein [Stenotrophobium rhamnosiphilum]|uniref:Tautomerase family protein n=1 Tax=Stenotrophobium rhamnosiphilum TaxID=2029166 RepID=A0A2T5MJB5_9GAMM|nr:tautomerase family protein [Stenotrophobium rhamnosiphilum]PTU32662.1 tautomerase family protein [Stenotrophobium rhamnosiphilum]